MAFSIYYIEYHKSKSSRMGHWLGRLSKNTHTALYSLSSYTHFAECVTSLSRALLSLWRLRWVKLPVLSWSPLDWLHSGTIPAMLLFLQQVSHCEFFWTHHILVLNFVGEWWSKSPFLTVTYAWGKPYNYGHNLSPMKYLLVIEINALQRHHSESEFAIYHTVILPVRMPPGL